MSQSDGNNSQGLYTSVAGKLLLRKLIKVKHFTFLLFLLKFKKDLWVRVIFHEV